MLVGRCWTCRDDPVSTGPAVSGSHLPLHTGPAQLALAAAKGSRPFVPARPGCESHGPSLPRYGRPRSSAPLSAPAPGEAPAAVAGATARGLTPAILPRQPPRAGPGAAHLSGREHLAQLVDLHGAILDPQRVRRLLLHLGEAQRPVPLGQVYRHGDVCGCDSCRELPPAHPNPWRRHRPTPLPLVETPPCSSPIGGDAPLASPGPGLWRPQAEPRAAGRAPVTWASTITPIAN